MLASGTVVDSKFEIISGLAMGGFGIIYQAKQLAFDRIVALKVLQSQTEIDNEDMKRFEREARILSSLRHRNLVTFYGFGATEHSLYIAMELVQGDSLESLLDRKKRLGTEETIHLIKQVCEALICAHSHGVVHRDLKPNNIMLVDTADGPLVKLIDFGLAKLITPDIFGNQKLTEPGSTVGSVEYMSPEQCVGRQADRRSDIYAIGCVLHHCLTGSPPFTGDYSVAVMHLHVKQPPPRLSAKVKTGISRELQFVVDKALAKEVTDRYQSIKDLLADLTTIESGLDRELIADGAPITGPLKSANITHDEPPKLTKLAITITGVCLALALGAAMVQYTLVALRSAPSGTSVLWYNQARNADGPLLAHDATLPRRLIELYTVALDRNKTDGLLDKNQLAQIYSRLAYVYAVRRDMRQAKQNAGQAIALLILDDKFNDTLLGVCEHFIDACDSLHRPKESVDTIQRVAQMWPVGRGNHVSIELLLVHAYESAGDFVSAKQTLSQLKQTANLTDYERGKVTEAAAQLAQLSAATKSDR